MSLLRPFVTDNSQVNQVEGVGIRMRPSDHLPKDGPWVPGENQGKLPTKSPTNPRGPALKPRVPFVVR